LFNLISPAAQLTASLVSYVIRLLMLTLPAAASTSELVTKRRARDKVRLLKLNDIARYTSHGRNFKGAGLGYMEN